MAHQSLSASSNLNNANGTARPESVDVSEAMALMADLGETGEDEAEEAASADEEEGDDAAADDSGEGDETADTDEEAEASAEDGEAPEFWSAEDKAAWKDVPPELRPVLKKYEQQRVAFVNGKAREAAQVRTQAAQDVERATG